MLPADQVLFNKDDSKLMLISPPITSSMYDLVNFVATPWSHLPQTAPSVLPSTAQSIDHHVELSQMTKNLIVVILY